MGKIEKENEMEKGKERKKKKCANFFFLWDGVKMEWIWVGWDMEFCHRVEMKWVEDNPPITDPRRVEIVSNRIQAKDYINQGLELHFSTSSYRYLF